MIGRALGVAIAVLCALAGCTAGPPPPPPGALEPAAGLIGLWRVQAVGEGSDTWARIAPGEIDVIRGRFALTASWATGGDRIVARITGFDGRLRDPSARWLTRASRFTRDGDGWVLQSASGDELARLRVDGAPAVPRGRGPEITRSPSVSPEGEPLLEVPTLPPGRAPSTAALTGTWRTGHAVGDETQPSLTFDPDGEYRGTDGCNGFEGGWGLLPDGRLLATGTIASLTACANAVPVGGWAARARSARISGGRLTLYDVRGRALGVLHR